ncbi:double-strand break repair helicase AddA [Oceanibaculum pacificum]|uniref:DNA 3'-5' helicase n=1 Tax=Oceanibaculum pacificum TaxID=580166 RepID=A0A154WFP2_9PROT|nr:double-strand break repair helicase AddA [Oceanibaculum pacificum]KZD12306.1 DNA helicase UvrD [Oceanibaculum pacificum]
MTTLLPDPAEAQRRAAHPRTSVWVGASAGTGKTKVLTDRVLGLLLQETKPERLLCLTFTKAAAAEMANRLNATLSDWAVMADDALADRLLALTGERPAPEVMTRARRLFAQVLDTPGGLKIQTIHAFCQALLRRFPLEADIAPHFEVMDEQTARELLLAARDRMLASARAGQDAALSEALSLVTARVNEDSFAALMDALASERGRLDRLLARHGGLEGLVAAIHARLDVPVGLSDRELIRDACADAAFDAAALRRAIAVLDGGKATDKKLAAALDGFLAATDRLPLYANYCGGFLTQKGEIRARLVTADIAAANPWLMPLLLREAERLIRLEARCRAVRVAAATAALLRLGDAMLATYRRVKQARALLDYDDLILGTRDLLRSGDGIAAWVLFKLDGGIDHVLIDEAQDTNPEQWELIEALTGEFFAGLGAREETRTIFAVGDVKQSIYSFQRAEPAEFTRMRDEFRHRAGLVEKAWDEVALHTSFRSTETVLELVDAVFALDPARQGVVEGTEPLRHLAFRRGQAGRVELWPLIAPKEREELEPWQPPVVVRPGDSPRASLATAIARRIRDWIGRDMLPSKQRPVRAGDILVLVRRRGGFVEELVRALKALEVPVAGIDRMVLTEQLAVMDLMALGDFLLLPEDDLTLATVLKGPLVGLTEEQLFEIAWNRKGGLWAALQAAPQDWAQDATRLLGDLLGRVDYLRPYELYAEALGHRRGREKLIGRLGYEADDPIDEFLARALAYEREHVPSLQGFLAWLRAAQGEIKRDLEAGRDEVRVMTAHGAKGLQAPIVILPDTAALPILPPPLLWTRDDVQGGLMLWSPNAASDDAVAGAARETAKRRQQEEYRRLLYVALTRAEDRLIICGWETRKKTPDECWYRLVEQAMRDRGRELACDFIDRGAVGRVLENPQNVTVTIQEKPHRAPIQPLSPEAWARAMPAAEPSPSRPLTPSRPSGEEPSVRSPLSVDSETEAARFKRGTLIHRLLQTLPDVLAERRTAAAARFLARPVHGLDAAQVAAYAAEALAVLDDPTFGAIFGPGSVAEVPVVGRIGQGEDSIVISGQIDRLLVSETEALIVDYKTNRPPPLEAHQVSPVYLRQMASYQAALEAVYPGRAIRCALLWTDGPRLMPLPDAILAPYRP